MRDARCCTDKDLTVSRFAQDSLEQQIPWIEGERFQLALDSRDGAINERAVGKDTLTVTTRRLIRLGHRGGRRTTAAVPLDRLTAIEVIDIERDNARLMSGLISLVVGAALGWVSWTILAVMPLSLVLGGLPVLVAVFLISDYVFTDEDGALVVYVDGYVLRQPLLSRESRRDAYFIAHRIYELMAVSASSAHANTEPTHVKNAGLARATQTVEQTLTSGEPEMASASSSYLASLITSRFEPATDGIAITDVSERVARCITATEGAASYVTRQIIRDPANQQLSEGDYVRDLEFVAPDRFRVSQTAWAPRGEIHDCWVSIGTDFYRLASAWQKPEDPSRFYVERQLNAHLTVTKYLNVLRQGYPTEYELTTNKGKQYLQVRYEPLGREALASVLGNASPPQGVIGSATIWIDYETDLLIKSEVKISEQGGDHKLIVEQAFAFYDTGLAVEAPSVPTRPESTS